ncbi:ABC transporter, ATP-binding protein, multidrug export [Streptococcus pneumoniae]|nr:ABC transporter, ATP-binding protein, multidrug export [Streptococcus pneumoniae]
MAILNPIMMGISSGLSVAIYWIGAYVINDAAPIARLPLFSDMIVFMSYAMYVGCHGLPSHGSTLHRSSPNYGLC